MNYIQNNLEKITFPFLLLHGSEDKICQLQGSTLMLEKSSSTDKTLKVLQRLFFYYFIMILIYIHINLDAFV